MYAVIDHKGSATIVSKTLHGVKTYATKHGFKRVCKVSPYSLSCYDILIKINGLWLSEEVLELNEHHEQ